MQIYNFIALCNIMALWLTGSYADTWSSTNWKDI